MTDFDSLRIFVEFNGLSWPLEHISELDGDKIAAQSEESDDYLRAVPVYWWHPRGGDEVMVWPKPLEGCVILIEDGDSL